MKTIVQLYNNQPADCSDFFYRVKQKSVEFVKHYAVTWINIINLHEDKFKICNDADLLIVNFVNDNDMLSILAYRNKHNLPTIYEINDNFLAFQATNPMFHFYSRIDTQAVVYQFISNCSGVQVSSKKLINALNLHTYIKEEKILELKNCIDEEVLSFKNRDEFIIGWGGSSGHYNDIKEIAPILINIAKKYNIKIAIKSDSKIISLFNELGDNLIAEKFSNLEDYFTFLQKLTIGICVIEKDKFNETRSDVKYLEYVQNGVIPVCSHFGPYEELPGSLLFNSNDELFTVLEKLLHNDELQNNCREASSKYVNEYRTTKKNIDRLYSYYSTFIEIASGVGVYQQLDCSTVYPDLYNMLSHFDKAPNRDYNNALFYYKKHYSNSEKIRYAMENIDTNSIILKKRYVELLIENGQINEATLLLENYIKEYSFCVDFIVMLLVIYSRNGDTKKVNGLKVKLKKVSPMMYTHYFN